MATVRIMSITLRNFKNVGYGKIDMPGKLKRNYDIYNSDIVGIYGQNGSGKTAVIDALRFLENIMSGKTMPENASDYIMKSKDVAEAEFEFRLGEYDNESKVKYSFIIKRCENGAVVSGERLSITQRNDDGKSITQRVEFNPENDKFISPRNLYNKITHRDMGNMVEVEVAKRMAIKEKRSLLFCEDFYKLLEGERIHYAIKSLRHYAINHLFIIKDALYTKDKMSLVLPALFSEEHSVIFDISLNKPTVMSMERYGLFKKVIMGMNKVLNSIIPDFKTEILEYGSEITQDGTDGMRFEVLSVRNDVKVPLRYESEGIKKLLCIINLLIAMFNNPTVCVMIDELDSGVFEYLLGELLTVIEDNGAGQLIFTSHNLRPLETIDRDAIVFTTTNPDNRYIRIPVKARENLRDTYLRSIVLGGMNESIYNSTNGFEITNAMRKAGDYFDESK